MFKAPFSFDGRIRRIEYFLSGIIGGIVSSIAQAARCRYICFGCCQRIGPEDRYLVY